jgi:putative tryptophan/tyrosine transport system substrate-binding protein
MRMNPRFRLQPLLTFFLFTFSFLLVACGSATSEPADSTEQRITIGAITFSAVSQPSIDGFISAMTERGYVEGESVEYVLHSTNGDSDAVQSHLQAFLDADVDLIFAADRPTALAAQQLTSGTDMPVIFTICGDPVAAGLVQSLEQPGGNMTGLSCTVGASGSDERRLELLLELNPNLERVYVPYNPDDPGMVATYNGVVEAASRLGIEVVTTEIRSVEEYRAALANFPTDIDAYFALNDALGAVVVGDILAVTFEQSISLSTPVTSVTQAGALMSYGTDMFLNGEKVARLADQVLQGADPGTLPVEAGDLVLAINLQTAETIGLDVPEAILEQADTIFRGSEQAAA